MEYRPFVPINISLEVRKGLFSAAGALVYPLTAAVPLQKALLLTRLSMPMRKAGAATADLHHRRSLLQCSALVCCVVNSFWTNWTLGACAGKFLSAQRKIISSTMGLRILLLGVAGFTRYTILGIRLMCSNWKRSSLFCSAVRNRGFPYHISANTMSITSRCIF